MNTYKSPFRPNILLWWVAIISLVVSTAIYLITKEQATYDFTIARQRIIILLGGFIIAGICLIVGTASRWFYPR